MENEKVRKEISSEQVPAPKYTEPILSDEQRLAKKIFDTNEGLKRINGYSPEYVAEGFEVSVEELFPSEGKTVYVGDPWQKLDRKGVTIVDYEFGPVAEFQDDKEAYLAILDARLDEIERNLVTYEDTEINDFLENEINLASDLYRQASSKSVVEYERISKEFSEMKQRIEDEIARETDGNANDHIFGQYDPSESVKNLWYVAVHGARAVDVLDWATELEPAYSAYKDELPEELPDHVREEKLKEKRRKLIEGIRFDKTAKEAEVVQAMFLFLPFENESFDRFVAFWSISTYAFEHLNYNDLTEYWKEIYRILKTDGKAYISPLFSGNEEAVEKTLNDFKNLHSDFTFEFDDDDFKNTLIIHRK